MPSLIIFRSSVNTIIYPYIYPIRATDTSGRKLISSSSSSRSHSHLEDFYTDPDNEDDNMDSDTDAETQDDPGPEDGSDTNYPLADFEALARRRPQEDFTLMGCRLHE
jgi:hypothetical protein